MKKLRRYQEKIVKNYLQWINSNDDENLATIILPTGVGKTLSACSGITLHLSQISHQFKILWVAHREELIDQAAEQLKELLPHLNIQIEMGKRRATADADIIVGSVQTIHRYRKNIHGFTPDLIVIDEWHHFSEANKTYNGIKERFPKAKMLGLTATPYRFSGGDLPLGHVLFEMDIGTAVHHNYLVPPLVDTIKTNISLANVHTKAGDFNITELSETVNVKERNEQIVKKTLELIKQGRQGILFAVDVDHSKTLCDLLKNKVRAAEIYGETDKDERREIIAKAKNGEKDVLCNYATLNEGLDIPHLSFAVMARPTKSLGFYIQCIGRVLRLFEGKKDAIIVDLFDKVKVTQKRITFSDMAAAGDLDGASKRTDAIMKEPIADKIKNFPVVTKLNDGERWTVDDTTWFAPAWQLADNQWAIIWNKTTDLIESKTEYNYVPFKYSPSNAEIKNNNIYVKHPEFGDGKLLEISEEVSLQKDVTVQFDNETKTVPLYLVLKREPLLEKVKLDVPVRRLIYLCTSLNGKNGRVVGMKYKNYEFSVTHDFKGDMTTLDEIVKTIAKEDEVTNLVRCSAKWRKKIASEKQAKFVHSLIKQGKLEDDIDLNNLTSGEASVLIDQCHWHGIINSFLGASETKDLIGYNNMFMDV